MCLFGVCLAAGIGELLLPSHTSAGTRRALRALTALLVLLLILTPFAHILKSNEEWLWGEADLGEVQDTDYERIFLDAVQAQSAKDLEQGLYTLLRSEYGIDEENCTILVYFDTDGSLRHVSLFLSGNALLQNPERLEQDLSERLCCSVEVR